MPGWPQPASEPAFTAYLGAVDWRHDAWLGGFYPEDLPEDWLLAFYNTQYHTVFLPYAHWATASGEELGLWREETQPGFRFVLEAPPPDGPPPLADPHILGDRLILLARQDDPALVWFDTHSNLKDLATEIGRHPKPLFLFSRDNDLQGLDRVSTLLELLGL